MRTQMRRRGVVALASAAALLAIAGVAYATIPDGGGVYTACRLNGVGTIRLIDPSGPGSSLLSHCTGLETQIQWNEKGQKGDTGATGPAGPAGANGVSPTVAQLSPGDTHCPAGGAAITDANGSTAYVCNGQDGQPGQSGTNGKDFSGTFTSPNGQFTLSVADSGVQITGPSASIEIDSSGDISITGGNVETLTAGNETVKVGGDRTENIAGNETVKVGGDRTVNIAGNETVNVDGDRSENIVGDETVKIDGNRSETVAASETDKVGINRSETVGANDQLTVGENRSESVGGDLKLTASGSLEADATLLGLNAGAACKPVARVGDPVDSVEILMGSPDICVD